MSIESLKVSGAIVTKKKLINGMARKVNKTCSSEKINVRFQYKADISYRLSSSESGYTWL